MRWEYERVFLAEMKAIEISNRFNELGKEGWELVAISDEVAYFKRPKVGAK